MIIKLLEVRDRATFVPVFAISTEPSDGAQAYLLRRCGYIQGDSIIVGRLSGESPCSADAYFWGNRTMQTAHHYIETHFNELKDGDVVDVEFVLGETKEKKVSERMAI